LSYLSILQPTEDEKRMAIEAAKALSNNWRKMGLSIRLKVHVMEAHAFDFHDKWNVGDKEESFIEQGHQIGIKDNHHHHGLKDFKKKNESAIRGKINCNSSASYATKTWSASENKMSKIM